MSSMTGPSQVKLLSETGLSGEEVCTVVGCTSPLVMPSSASRPSTLQVLSHSNAFLIAWTLPFLTAASGLMEFNVFLSIFQFSSFFLVAYFCLGK